MVHLQKLASSNMKSECSEPLTLSIAIDIVCYVEMCVTNNQLKRKTKKAL